MSSPLAQMQSPLAEEFLATVLDNYISEVYYRAVLITDCGFVLANT